MGKSRGSRFYKEMRLKGKSFSRYPQFVCSLNDVVRSELYGMNGKIVNLSGELTMQVRGPKIVPLLLGHVVVNGIYLDHIWIKVTREVWHTLALNIPGSRIYMTGEVFKYSGNTNLTKMGIRDIKLISS